MECPACSSQLRASTSSRRECSKSEAECSRCWSERWDCMPRPTGKGAETRLSLFEFPVACRGKDASVHGVTDLRIAGRLGDDEAMTPVPLTFEVSKSDPVNLCDEAVGVTVRLAVNEPLRGVGGTNDYRHLRTGCTGID